MEPVIVEDEKKTVKKEKKEEKPKDTDWIVVTHFEGKGSEGGEAAPVSAPEEKDSIKEIVNGDEESEGEYTESPVPVSE